MDTNTSDYSKHNDQQSRKVPWNVVEDIVYTCAWWIRENLDPNKLMVNRVSKSIIIYYEVDGEYYPIFTATEVVHHGFNTKINTQLLSQVKPYLLSSKF